MELTRKLLAGSSLTLADQRLVKVVCSTSDPDRMGDVIVQTGIDLAAYRNNPIVLWGHSADVPIARAIEIDVKDGKLQATVQFPPEGDDEDSDWVYGKIKAGIVNATSVGFIPKDYEPLDSKQPWGGFKFLKSELLEFSFVSVPANSGCLIVGRSLFNGVDIPSLPSLARYNEDQPRDSHGRFGSGTPGNRAVRDKLDELGPVGRLLTAAHVGHVAAGVGGAVLGATLSAFVDSGGAKHIGLAATIMYGLKILPKWGYTLLFNLMGFSDGPPPPPPGKSISLRRDTNDDDAPVPTDEQLLQGFKQLSDSDAKRLATEILKELSQGQKQDVLNVLLEEKSGDEKSVASSGVWIPRNILEEAFRLAKTPRAVRQKYLAKSEAADWKVGASRDLPIDDSDSWDGPAAAKRMLDEAGFDGDSPDAAKAARGFLMHDAANPMLRGSYKLPFADIVGGTLKAVKRGLSAAKGRLDQTDAPSSVLEEAAAVIAHYEQKESKEIIAPVEKSGRKISSANAALLQQAMDHHESATKCIKDVLASNATADPDEDDDMNPEPDNSTVPTVTVLSAREQRLAEAKALRESINS